MFENHDAFIFDMDGTLVDTGDLHEDAWVKTLYSFGIPVDRALMRSLCGVSTLDTLSLLIDKFKVQTDVSPSEIAEFKESIVINSSAQNVKPTRLQALVKRYAGKRLMSVGTGAHTREAQNILLSCDLHRYFQHIVGANLVEQSKPSPDIFLLCAELMGVNPRRCIVFEDAPLGVQAAMSAGMSVVDVSLKYQIENSYFL